jgi:hypothetical protein
MYSVAGSAIHECGAVGVMRIGRENNGYIHFRTKSDVQTQAELLELVSEVHTRRSMARSSWTVVADA